MKSLASLRPAPVARHHSSQGSNSRLRRLVYSSARGHSAGRWPAAQPDAQLGVRTTTRFCCSTEVHPHAGVLPCTVTLKVFAANPVAAKSRSYLPGPPGTTHEAVPASALHWTEPDAAPESVSVRPGTSPPLAEDTRTTMAIGSGHGGLGQSGFVDSLHPIHAPRTAASPKTPRRPSVITLALPLASRSAERPWFTCDGALSGDPPM
jgi:hypothetical protein